LRTSNNRRADERFPDSGGNAASLLPGCCVCSENVGFGDASVGVARNPLRDGAPPTGVFVGPLSLGTTPFPPLRTSTKPFAALHRCRGLRLSTWVAVWRGVTRLVRPTFSSSRASAFVKTLCKSTRQRRCARIDYSSPRSFPMRRPSFLAPSSALGLVLPGRARPLPRVEVERPVLIDFRLSRIDGHRVLRTLRVTSECGARRIHVPSLAVEDPVAVDERANARRRRSNPKRVQMPEASGVAPPLPPSQSHQLVANDSVTPRATPFAAPTIGRG
jgi:hypothetical protein